MIGRAESGRAPRPRTAAGLAREIGATLGAYVWGQILISLIEAVLFTAGFALLGLPLWFLLGPVCGLLNLIPRFGNVIAMLLGIAAAVIGGLSLERLLGVVGVFVAVFALEGFWLTPRILGRRLKLRPLYVFLAVLVGGAAFGFVGLLLAVPALAVIAVIYRFFNRGDTEPDESRRRPPGSRG